MTDERWFQLGIRWLQLSLAASVVVGVLLVAASGTALFATYHQSAADAFYGGVPLTGASLDHQRWLLSVSGSGTVGWAITLLFVVTVPLQRRERWAWWCVVVSVVVWVVVDAAASVVWGVFGEVIFVACAGFGLLVPALLVRRGFSSSATAPPAP